MEEVILGIRVGHGRARVGWVEVLFSLSNLTCRDRPHPPQARALGNLLHSGLALARPPLRSSPRINLQKLCYTAWVVAPEGWQPLNHTLLLEPGQKETFKIDLHATWADQGPRLDARKVSHLQLILSRPQAQAEVSLSNVTASGIGPPAILPFGKLLVPAMEEGAPAAGKRVKEQLPAYQKTELYHALYLPTDWRPGRRFPIIVEYSGNEWYDSTYSTGRPEGSNMGYGMSMGRGFIWVVAPCVNKERSALQVTWYDPQATADYAVDLVRWICEQYGGDSSAVFLAGFSRGAHACNVIGLNDELVADLWLGFHPCQHYDSGAGSADRFARIRGRATFQTDNDKPEIRKLFEASGFPVQFAASGLGYHSDVMFLDNRASTLALRDWMREVLEKRPGTHSLSGVVRDALGKPVPRARVESGTHFTFTDEEGRYELRSLIDGPRRVAASREGVNFGSQYLHLSGQDLSGIDFILGRNGAPVQ